MKSFNLQLLRGSGGVKKSDDLVPKFYWKHRDVKPFLFMDEELSVQHTEEEEAKSVEEAPSRCVDALKRFSSQQKELLREIGGLPQKLLVSKSFRQTASIQRTVPRVENTATPKQRRLGSANNTQIGLKKNMLNKSSLNQASTLPSTLALG